MANLRLLNQQNPFWDWVGEMDNSRQARHAHFEDNGEGPSPREVPEIPEASNHHQGPPPPPPDHDHNKAPEFDGPPDPPTPPTPPHHPGHGEHAGPPPPFPPGVPHHHPHHQGPPGWGGRGRHGHRGGHFGGPHDHESGWRGRGGFFGGPFGGRGGGSRRGRGGFPAWARKFGLDKDSFDMEAMAQFCRDNFGFDFNAKKPGEDKDFTPPIDIFDTPAAYYVHMSVAGAKKQDLGVNWDPENSEVHVMGVIHRPGDEEFLKTIALDERDIGVFERKIKLGSKTQPASVDADGITAKMEDGVLMVKVPKIEEFVEIKKVDIE